MIRAAFALIAAAVVAVIAFAVLAHGSPTVGTVYDTDVRGPKVTFDGRPEMERGPQFRIRVGETKKTARWVRVNPVQYASCAAGNQWNGTLCSKFELELPGFSMRTAVLVGIGLAMAGVPAVALTGRSS